ncbi:pseudouridine synthase [Rhabdochlamydiaceae symbiont of Dictyostelium giganteum]|uniref:pseudouridine synthase n=1 Tax=Rhabdochlamydiaceae symbiont of Dictyostelium giganteum TaxID=3342349 RepID=UPI00384BDDD1
MKRLSKALAAAGVASRRACEQLIFEGKVSVNGEIVRLPQTLVEWGKDVIAVQGTELEQEQEKVYFMLNKPRNYICSHFRQGTKKLVVDLFDHLPYRLFTVGRLDRDTTGLLIVTNDGHFAQDVIHPSKGLTKEYLVKTTQEITHEHLIDLSKGGLVEGTWVKPTKVAKVRKGTLTITVQEGKKREVRLLVQKAGLDLISLHRIRIGSLVLGPLEEGEFRPLSEHEKDQLLQLYSAK